MPEEIPSPNPTKPGSPTPIASSPIDPLRPLPAPSWRDRLAALRAAVGLELSVARGAAAVVVALGVALGAFVVLRQPSVPAPELTLPMASPVPSEATGVGGGASGEVPGERPAEIVVHAAGAVAAPGLYRLSDGARVDDVVRAAGGPAPDAQLERLNLAAPVVDGERVYVPRAGEDVPADIVTGSPGTGGAEGPGAGPAPVDLNAASATELDTLPGVGPATAEAIIANREANGGFRSVEELLDVRGIGDVKLAELRDLVTV